MSATTITAEATAADLATALRELADRCATATSLDELRECADKLTATVRRARGRINRIVKASAPPVVEPKPAAAPAPAATKPAPERPAVAEKPRESAPAAAPVRPRPAPRRRATSFHVALAVLTAVAVVWSTTSAPVDRATRRAVRAVRTTGRRAATAIRTTLARLGGAS